MSENVAGKKIFVGLSGGVDSSVTAYLLKKAGADVVGVFIKGWYPPGMPCLWASDRRDAMRVAAELHIPFYTLEAGGAYKKSVIDYLVDEYRRGRTPNPDIMCNRDVKFGVFYEFAKRNGVDFIATGHYARVKNGKLYRGKDAEKDQSYFLYTLASDILQHTLFPLGDMVKGDVRKEAARAKLVTAKKPDSQGICFLGEISIDEFLRHEFGSEKGVVRDGSGAAIGTHEGVFFATLGERLAIPDAKEKGPWYVYAKDIEKNELLVTKNIQKAAMEQGSVIHLRDIYLRTENTLQLTAESRYHGPLVTGTLSDTIFTADKPFPELVAPGQSLVFYQGDECVGGGIIELCSQKDFG